MKYSEREIQRYSKPLHFGDDWHMRLNPQPDGSALLCDTDRPDAIETIPYEIIDKLWSHCANIRTYSRPLNWNDVTWIQKQTADPGWRALHRYSFYRSVGSGEPDEFVVDLRTTGDALFPGALVTLTTWGEWADLEHGEVSE